VRRQATELRRELLELAQRYRLGAWCNAVDSLAARYRGRDVVPPAFVRATLALHSALGDLGVTDAAKVGSQPVWQALPRLDGLQRLAVVHRLGALVNAIEDLAKPCGPDALPASVLDLAAAARRVVEDDLGIADGRHPLAAEVWGE
jgi:hypothetical protein